MRLFGGDRIDSMMNALKIDENMPIENKMLSNVIENAQNKVEGRNFSIRKNVLNFDDVMNRQREIIYSQRAKVLNGEDLHESIVSMIKESIQGNVDTYLADGVIHDEWNIDGLRDYYRGFLTSDDDLNFTPQQLGDVDKKDIFEMLWRFTTSASKCLEASLCVSLKGLFF